MKYEMYISKKKILYQYISELLYYYLYLCNAFNNQSKAQTTLLHLSLLCKLQTS